jgi:sporulation protein YlmC with PRC-barrel domain
MAGMQAAIHGKRVLRPPLRRMVGADDLLGLSVISVDGEQVGDVRELMLDITSGQIVYAIVALGRPQDLLDHLVAVPWSAFHVLDDGELAINLTRETVEQGLRLPAPSAVRLEQTRGLVLHPSFERRFRNEKGRP